jgi:hypothetical protein
MLTVYLIKEQKMTSVALCIYIMVLCTNLVTTSRAKYENINLLRQRLRSWQFSLPPCPKQYAESSIIFWLRQWGAFTWI